MEISSSKEIKVVNRPWGANVDEKNANNLVRISGEGPVQVFNISYQVKDEEPSNAKSDLR